jgi:hypothetical protein
VGPVREGTTSRVKAAERPYGEFYDFYSVGSEYFGYTHVATIDKCLLCVPFVGNATE